MDIVAGSVLAELGGWLLADGREGIAHYGDSGFGGIAGDVLGDDPGRIDNASLQLESRSGVRPEANGLRAYYLCIATGGAAGGVLCGVIAPMMFESISEYPLVITVTAALLSVLVARHGGGVGT